MVNAIKGILITWVLFEAPLKPQTLCSSPSWVCEQAGIVTRLRMLFRLGDIPMAQFLVSINDSMPNAHKFIVYMLDDTHIYVQPDVGIMLSKKLQEFRDQNTYEKPFAA